MKRLLLLFLLLPFLSYSQEELNYFKCDFKIDRVNDSTYKIQVYNFDSLHTGETCFLSWMNSGKSKPDGTLLVFDENGIKRRMAIYKNEIRVGNHVMWYASGEVESETIWETDLYFNSKGYYRSGKLKHTAENGNRENAVYKSYFENGQLESISDWANGGDRYWYENGNLQFERNTKTNIYKEWYGNGQIKIEGKLKQGWIRTGKWSYYNEAGKLTKELFYNENNNLSWYGDEAGLIQRRNIDACRVHRSCCHSSMRYILLRLLHYV